MGCHPVIVFHYIKLSQQTKESKRETLAGFEEVSYHLHKLIERAIWQTTVGHM